MRLPPPSRRSRRGRRPRAALLALAGLSATLALGAADAGAIVPSNTATGDWTIVGGPVNAVARSGDAVYLGGKFQGLARHAPGLAAFDPAGSGDFRGPAARLDPLDATTPVTVTAITGAPDGGVYVAGDFAGAGGLAQPELLRFGPSGALDEAFRPQVPVAEIRDMEVSADGALYLAGDFKTVGGRPRNGLAAVDAASGAVTAWQPTAGGVTQLAVSPDAVYLGGTFTEVSGQARANAAAVDPDSGAVLDWNPRVEFGSVETLELDGSGPASTVYLGGSFLQVGGETRNRLAAVAATGAGALRAWNPAPNAAVQRIAVSGSRVFVVGRFLRIGAPQQPRQYLAAVDATTGEALAWAPPTSRTHRPSNLVLSDGRVHVSWNDVYPSLPTLAGEARCGLAAVDAQTGAITPWDPRVAGGTELACEPATSYRPGVDALAVAGGRVWAGGRFSVADIRRRSGLAALNAATEAPLAWAPRLDGAGPFGPDIVYDIAAAPDGGTIYVGGVLSKVGGVTRTNAAAFTAAGTLTPGGELTAWNPAPNRAVRTLAPSPDGALVYLGGDFDVVGGVSRRRLAAVGARTGGAGSALPSPSGPVWDLLVDPPSERLFVAGQFGMITDPAGTVPRAGLAAIDVGAAPAAARVLDWDAGLTSGAEVEALALRGSQLVAGGRFARLGGPSNLAAFELGDAALAPWSPQIPTGAVQTVTIDPADGVAYVTGTFTSVGGARRDGVAAVDADGAATGWDPAPSNNFPPPFGLNPPPPPGGIVLLGADRLLLTGAFTRIGGRHQAGFAVFREARSAPVPIAPPTVTVKPPASPGTAVAGAELTCRPGRWAGSGATRTIAWLRDGEPIAGQDRATYRSVPDDRGSRLQCRETMTNAVGTASQVSAAVSIIGLAPARDSPPAVAGQPWVGGTAQCTTGLWQNAPTAYRYRWRVDGRWIEAATSASYAPTAAEQGLSLACEVTAENAYGSATALSAEVTITEAPPAAIGGPLISGDPRVGSSLTCDPGAWERARGFAYQWLRDRVPLVDAVAPTYVATSRDLGRALTCLVTADNAGGTASAESFAVVVAASARSTGTGRRANPEDDASSSIRGATAARARAVRIRIRMIRLLGERRLAVSVATPAAGRVSVTVVRSTGARTRAGKPTTAVLARGSRTVRRAAPATVEVELFSTARRLLARAGRRGLRVTVRVGFRPAKRGAASSSARSTRTLVARAEAKRR